MTGPDQVRPEPGPDADADEIQADIEQTREQLGKTIDALGAKLDVKERTRQKAVHTKETIAHKADAVRHSATDRPGQTVPVVVAVALLAVIGLVVWRRRR